MKMALRILAVVVLIGLAIGIYLYNKPHRDLTGEAPAYTLSAQALSAAYQKDSQQADSLYLDQVVAVSGEVSSTEAQAVVLEDKIYCSLDSASPTASFTEGQAVSIKGRVIGYDALFEQVKLDHALLYQDQ